MQLLTMLTYESKTFNQMCLSLGSNRGPLVRETSVITNYTTWTQYAGRDQHDSIMSRV